MQHQQRRARFGLWLSITIVAGATLAVAASYGTAPSAKPSMAKATHPPQVRDAYGHLPLSFEENRGQTDPQVKFLARGGGYSLFLTPTEAVLKLRAPASVKKQAKPGAMPIAFHPESIQKPKFSVVRIRLEAPILTPPPVASIRCPGIATTSSVRIARSGAQASRLTAVCASKASIPASTSSIAARRAASNMTS
jgi:hypothetical protein